MLKIAHRGASGYMPENTLAAFKKAVEMGADMIEFDVRLCKSGELVIIHDATVNRTTNGKGKVKDMTLSEIKNLNAGSGERIPTLEEAFNLLKKKVSLDLNVKEKQAWNPTILLVKEYEKKSIINPKKIFVSSNKFGILKQVYSMSSSEKVLPLILFFPRIFLSLSKRYQFDTVAIYRKVINQKIVDIGHRYGLKIYVWVVNNPVEIQQMKNLGVDGIMSDYPDRL